MANTRSTIQAVAGAIKSGSIKRIVVLSGAGISVSSGIPDFRSPGGMYDTLKPELLTATENARREMMEDPTTVVSWSLFQTNPLPYLELRRPFILGLRSGQAALWKPSLSHFFFKILEQKGLLSRIYTQNIDGLDYRTGIPDQRIISVHGSLARARCEFCGKENDFEGFCDALEKNVRNIFDGPGPSVSTPIHCTSCGSPAVKADTVLYGRQLPSDFHDNVFDDMEKADMLIVAGTSLTVSPANQLVRMASNDAIRVLLNKELVGEDLGFRPDIRDNDHFIQGECDEVCLKLADSLGWLPEVTAIGSENMAPSSWSQLQAHVSAN